MPDCCAYVRSHLAPPGEEKVRAVWGYPMALTLAEAIFAIPLTDAYRTSNRPIAYGYETAMGGTRRVLRKFARCKNICALDFKSFDKTVPSWLVDAAFYVLEQNLDFTKYQDYGAPNVTGTLRLWNALKTYFVKTPIRMANGERYKKLNGIASGSYFTQLVGSICNAILLNYVSLKLCNAWPVDYIVFGDNLLVSFPTYLPIEQIDDVLSQFGLMLNLPKSSQSDNIADLDFLGYGLAGSLPRKEPSAWIYALLYPEHPDPSWDDCASHALGLYYANLGIDGHFHELASRVIQHQSFDLHLSKSLEKMLRIIGFDRDIFNNGRNLPTMFEMIARYVHR